MTEQEQGSYALYRAAASQDWIVLNIKTYEVIYQGLEGIAEAIFTKLVAAEQLPHLGAGNLRAGIHFAPLGHKNAEGEGRNDG